METHSKAVFYIGNRNTNINYLIKSNIDIFVDNLFDDLEFLKPGNLDPVINIAISSLKDDSRDSSVYTYEGANAYNYKFNDYITNRKFLLGKKSSEIWRRNESVSSIIKPLKNIPNAGHYIINNNNSDIIVTSDTVSASSVFLVNNCTKDMSAFVFVDGNRIEKLYLGIQFWLYRRTGRVDI